MDVGGPEDPDLETSGRALIMANSLLSAVQFIARPLEKVESQFSTRYPYIPNIVHNKKKCRSLAKDILQ